MARASGSASQSGSGSFLQVANATSEGIGDSYYSRVVAASGHPDVIVVGLGGMGSAALCHLARRGVRAIGHGFKFSPMVGEILADGSALRQMPRHEAGPPATPRNAAQRTAAA